MTVTIGPIQIRIRPSRLTSIIVTTVGSVVKVEAVGIDDGLGTAEDLRAIAGALMRYAERLDPLFVETLKMKTIQVVDLHGAIVDALRANPAAIATPEPAP